jgi:hypothetical protein
MDKDTTPFQRPLSPSSIRAGKRSRDLSMSQEIIYSFLLEIVKSWQPERTLEHFKELFLYNTQSSKFPTTRALQDILMANDPEVFRQTLKRSCYILINNWDRLRKGIHIKSLVDSFQDPILSRQALGASNQRLRLWLKAFIESQDYQDLLVFASRFEDKTENKEKKKHWSDRYSHYLLINQSENTNNSTEQREAARTLTEKVRHRFRLDLALFVAHTQNPTEGEPIEELVNVSSFATAEHENPTGLGETTLHLIKSLVMRRGMFSQKSLAHIFLEQVKDLSYFSYKNSLFNYLLYSNESQTQGSISQLKQKLHDRLDTLYTDWEEEDITDDLMLRTCNQLINFFTTENNQAPSTVFTLFISQGHSLILAILLLKLILISPASRNHLDLRISSLVRFYQGQNPDQSEWFGHFLDIINVALAIYTEGVEYNLISWRREKDSNDSNGTIVNQTSSPSIPVEPKTNITFMERYKIFSQVCGIQTQNNPKPPRPSSPEPDSTPVPPPETRYDAVTGEVIWDEIVWDEPS